jgi:glycosyltransferase involved in cell wall biosynthesis
VYNFPQIASLIRRANPTVKIVLHMQCEWLTQLDPGLIGRRLRDVDLIIACSDSIADQIRRCFPAHAARCRTILNGVDVAAFHANGPGRKGTGDDDKRLLYVGRVSPEKGVHVLLGAFGKVLQRYPRAMLEIVGPPGIPPGAFIAALSDDPKVSGLAPFYEGGYLAYLQASMAPPVAARVSFVGALQHSALPARYQDADVFVFPSVWDEPFGIPIVEAMACGVPVVATRGGGIPEIVVEGKTGLLVERGDPDALAESLLQLLGADEWRQSLGAAGRERAIDLFSWDRIAEHTWREYQRLSGGR